MFIIEELIKRAKGGDSSAVDEIIQKFSCFVIKQAAKCRIPSYEFDDNVKVYMIVGIKNWCHVD